MIVATNIESVVRMATGRTPEADVAVWFCAREASEQFRDGSALVEQVVKVS
jgi:hypothetical protein